MKLLLVAWDGAGSFTPERSLVRALVARGHAVRVLGHDSLRPLVEADGAGFEPLRTAPQYTSTTEMTAEEELAFMFESIWLSKAYAADTFATIERTRPDLLLVDAALAYAMAAALASGLPTVGLWSSTYGLFAGGPFQQVLDARMPEIDAYAEEHGLARFASYRSFLEAGAGILVFGFRPFDPVADLAPHVRHVGPLRARPNGSLPWRRQHPEVPLVLVSLSTGYQAQTELLSKIAAALGSLELEAIITTGPAVSPDVLAPAANTRVVRHVDHDAVLAEAALLITHAGHGTVMAGVLHGVPMLCIPMGRDQPLIAGRVAALGLGRLADPGASVAEIREAVVAALADRHAREASAAFARSLADHPGVEEAVATIEDLFASNPRASVR